MGNFKEDIARIRAFVFDVDGVMTDGGITVTPEGEFLRTFYAKDGYALSLALKKGYRIAIITGGRGKALQVRFDMIGIEHVYTNATTSSRRCTSCATSGAWSPTRSCIWATMCPIWSP